MFRKYSKLLHCNKYHYAYIRNGRVISVWAFDREQPESKKLVAIAGLYCHLIGKKIDELPRQTSSHDLTVSEEISILADLA